MLLRITLSSFVIVVSFLIFSSIANVYAEQNEEQVKMQRLLQDLVGNYNINQDSSSLTSNRQEYSLCSS